jgi:hypothetical protein
MANCRTGIKTVLSGSIIAGCIVSFFVFGRRKLHENVPHDWNAEQRKLITICSALIFLLVFSKTSYWLSKTAATR